jgi:hypothetical protein
MSPASRQTRLTRTKPRLRTNPSDGPRSRAVVLWHIVLRAIAVLNVALWLLCAVAVTHPRGAISAASDTAFHLQLLLSAGYVFGCAFRSVLPVYDVGRLVLVDSRLSSVLVGRSVATIAELCFATQWALILHGVAVLTGSSFAQAVSLVIVPLIVLAEVCSWYAVLTTAQHGHVVENSIWGVSAALVVVSLLVIGPHRVGQLYPPLLVWCIAGAVYVAFIFVYDVPMYWSRWLADRAAGRRHLKVAHGLVDVGRRWTVSYRWEDWKNEVAWMSLYFSAGVWISLWLVYASVALGGATTG